MRLSALAARPPLTHAPRHFNAVAQPAVAAGRRAAAARRLRAAGRPQAPAIAPASLDKCPSLAESYTLGREIGRGSFALVLEALDRRTGERVAVKKLPKFKHARLPAEQAEVVAAEADALRTLSAACPTHVLGFRGLCQDENYFYLVTELCLGDLAHYLAGRPCERLSEREAAWIVQQVLAALAACHRAGLAYRDIKPHNLLLRGVDASGRPSLVLADFGCARSTADVPPSAHVSAGTPLYSAPECVHGTGGMHSDVWSVGVLLYSLLTGGRFPFCDPKHSITQGEYWRRVAEQAISFTGSVWHGVSPGAVALLRRMLERDCSRRATVAECLQDPWLAEMTSSVTSPAAYAAGSSNVLPGAPRHLVAAAASA